jgi:hypothetical protein
MQIRSEIDFYQPAQNLLQRQVIIMNQQESDQILQQLFFQMENFFSQTIENDAQRIELKPQFAANCQPVAGDVV